MSDQSELDKIWKESARHGAEMQRQAIVNAELQAMSRENQERHARILAKWEDLTKRMEAIIARWEQT
jgi:hypothetical protein